MRVIRILAAIFGALIVVAIMLLIVGLPGGLLSDVIQNRIERQTGYRLEIGATKISLRPQPTVHLTGVSLSDPRERENSVGLAVDDVTAKLSLADLLGGKLHIDDLTMVRPVLRGQMHRERRRARPAAENSSPGKPPSSDALLTIGHVGIEDGTIVLADKRRNIENRLDKVAFDLTVADDRKVKANFRADAAGQTLALEAGTTIPDGTLAGMVLPVDFTFRTPGILREQISAAAQVRLDGSVISIDGIKGSVDGANVSGNASVDIDSKPLVKATLDIERVSVRGAQGGNATAPTAASPQPAALTPWSDKPFDLRGLNYFDAQARITIGTLNLDKVQIAPVEIDATITDGVVRGTLSKMGVYEGQAAAGAAMDASSDPPSFALRAELRQVRALPLLSNAADFTSLDGKLDATINVQAIGGNPRDVIASLTGMTVVNFQNGEIRGINLAKMIRALTSGTLTGWQEAPTENTDLTELAATFRIEKGQAMTQDLHLAGPLVRVSGIGTVDLNTKAINFRTEPKLVMTLQGQGGAADPVGLGIPVMVQGPWTRPRIFPDVAGILDNPDGAYAQLRQLGQGLFGSNFLQQPTGCAPAGGNAGATAANAQDNAAGNLMNNIGAVIKQFTSPQPDPGGGTSNPPSQQQQAASTAPCPGQSAPSGAVSSAPTGNANPEGQVNQIIKNLMGK
jgi:AsmA protein